MKPTLLMAMFISLFTVCQGLSSYGDTPDFTIDTTPPVVQLLSPNGGEILYIGDTKDILWTATDTNLHPTGISLWYSLNGGTSYTPIQENIAHSGTFTWNLPPTQSTSAKVRLKAMDTFGNGTMLSSLNPFTISYVPPASPNGVNVNITNSVDAILTWDAVTQTIPPYNTPITPDGYIVLYNETPLEEDQYYYFLGETDQLTYTHQRVARFRSQMFYKVVAYKNYSREDASALKDIVQRSKIAPISWQRAKSILMNGGR